MFVDIAFPISTFKVFTYKVPSKFENSISVGCLVKAPLKEKESIGIIIDIRYQLKIKAKLKSISKVDRNPVINKEIWDLANWISTYYFCPIGQVIKALVPFDITTKYKTPMGLYISLTNNVKNDLIEKLKKNAPKQYELYNYLLSINKPVAISEIRPLFLSISSLCHSLKKKKLIMVYKQKIKPKSIINPYKPIIKRVVFNRDQKKVNKKLISFLELKLFYSVLLHGVTGSGKTEVFINAVNYCISQNRTSIILLPEISLTPQIAGRFKAVFGDIIAIWHSKLTKKQKWVTWNGIINNKYKIIIGARSAVFSPLKNLGLIVVDEEHESSFRQENPSPRYNARDVALVRGKKSNALVLLSSATPSLETYYNCIIDKIKYLSLPKRFGKSKYPRVHLVNMNIEKNETGRRGLVLSSLLQKKIEEKLIKKEQVILILNRRGYSPIIRCFKCENIICCAYCEVPLTYHKQNLKLICHLCGIKKDLIKKCTICNSNSIKYMGFGTQKIESIISNIFPEANISRLDTDVSQNSKKLNDVLQSFYNRNTDILIGTQMIAKGLDFPNATLVGIINADIGLSIPDFRSEERIFQLLYQASGRSGRGAISGDVIVQTFQSKNPVIEYAVGLKLKPYYDLILKERKELKYPPYSWITKIEFLGLDKFYIDSFANKVKNGLIGKYKGLDILGPAPCHFEKINNKYRVQLIFKSIKKFDPNSSKLQFFIGRNFIKNRFALNSKKCKINIHRDPLSLV